MIIKPPKTERDRRIYNIITTREDFLITKKATNKETKQQELVYVWSEADKAILYDFCTQLVPKYARIPWDKIDLDKYVTNIKTTYDRNKHSPMINVVSICINNLNLGYKTTVDGNTIVKI